MDVFVREEGGTPARSAGNLPAGRCGEAFVGACDSALNVCLCIKEGSTQLIRRLSDPNGNVFVRLTPEEDGREATKDRVVSVPEPPPQIEPAKATPAVVNTEGAATEGEVVVDALGRRKTLGRKKSIASGFVAAKWPCNIISPTSTWKVQWDTFIMLLIIYASASVPVRVAFNVEPEGWVWVAEASMSIIFIVDIIFTFHTAVLFEGEWVTAHGSIVGRYMRSWFWIDVPSSVPVELIEL